MIRRSLGGILKRPSENGKRCGDTPWPGRTPGRQEGKKPMRSKVLFAFFAVLPLLAGEARGQEVPLKSTLDFLETLDHFY
jgi:hypothetical protein